MDTIVAVLSGMGLALVTAVWLIRRDFRRWKRQKALRRIS